MRLASGYAGPCPSLTACGEGGAVYRYVGTGATLNLGAVDYTTSDWVKLTGAASRSAARP